MYKCDRCWNRIDQGELPACIEACPYEVQTIGPRSQILEAAHALARSMNGFIYGEHENGGTNTLYVSPVPFDILNNVISPAPGRPHLEAVPNPFLQEERLARAVFAAPFAGLAAGALHLLRSASEHDHD